MPRESISTPSGASCRRPIPTSRHKKGNPFTPMCLVCRYAWFAVVFAAIPLLCRSFPAAAFSAAILSLSQCCRAVISPAAAFMRLHIGAPRRASLLCRSFPAAAFSAAILSLSQCCRAVISPAAAFMRLHFGAPRRASLLRRSFLAAAFSAAILALSQCCRAVISPAAAFMRLHFGAPRRASLPCCRLVPGDGRERTWPECRQQEVPTLRPGLPGP